MSILKPFVLLACVAFTVGFVGYWALVGVTAPPASAQAPVTWSAEAQLLAAPDLATGKHI